MIWAEGAGTIPPFDGVIQMLSVKYLMFDGNGRPVRATVGLKVLEAADLAVGKPARRRS